MPSHSSSLKTRCLNISLLLGSLVFLFILLEIILRLIGYNPFGEFFENEGRAVFIQPSQNPQRIFEATPNAKGKGWGTHIAINSHGFRGREYSLEKPRDVYRIVVLGDSITFGNNLPADQNYPARLEKLFTENGKRVEVLNLGLGGYDTLQEVATLQDIGLAFSPDLVILGYCINDIGIASGNLNYIKRLKNYGQPIYHSRLAQFIRVQLDRVDLIEFDESANSDENFNAVYKNYFADTSQDEVLAKQIQNLEKLLKENPEKYLFARDYTQNNHIQRLRYALEQLQTLQKKNSFDVAVLVIPYLLENNKSQRAYRAVYQVIEHEMTRLHFAVINPYQEFSQTGFDNLILKKNDGIHPNALGHEIMANVLYKNIIVK